jgi:hypothetical protein
MSELARFGVTEHDGVARRGFPVTGGIPLARGTVTEASELGLVDDRGAAVPLQAQATSRWPDGSVRWVLLDFPVELGALLTREYRLVAGPASTGIEIKPDGIVDGEPLPRRAGKVAVSGSRLQVVDAEGHSWEEREPGPTTVLCRGPRRTTVLTTGTVYAPGRSRCLKWQARTSFYEGTPWTRTQLTYLADAGPEPLELQDLAVVAEVAPGAGPRRCCYSPATAPWAGEMTPLVVEQTGLILQTAPSESQVVATDGTVLREQTLKNRGYVGIGGETGGIALGLADLWQSSPKAMRVTERTLEAALWPCECGEPFLLPAGAARTHTLTLMAYATAEELDATLLGLTTPLLPRLAVEDLNATGVMPALLRRAEAPAPLLEALTESMFRGWDSFTNEANCGVWGLGELHFGDFTAEDYVKRGLGRYYGGEGIIWGNHEAQVPYGFLVQYLRTGEPVYLLQGLACARHQADVDTIHADADEHLVGGQHGHSVNHTAGSVGPSHMWTSGIALGVLLTGEERLAAVLRETGEHLLRAAAARDLDHIKQRDGGWLLIALCACYEALGDERYLRESRRLTEGLRRWIDSGATCLVPPAIESFAPVHLFIALTGVRDYWRLSGDDLAQETLLIGGTMALEQGRSDLGFFIMEDAQAYRYPSRWQLCHCLPIMETLHEITGDPEWIAVGARQAALMLRLLENETRWDLESNWAQGGIYFAYAFSFFETARKLGLLSDLRP